MSELSGRAGLGRLLASVVALLFALPTYALVLAVVDRANAMPESLSILLIIGASIAILVGLATIVSPTRSRGTAIKVIAVYACICVFLVVVSCGSAVVDYMNLRESRPLPGLASPGESPGEVQRTPVDASSSDSGSDLGRGAASMDQLGAPARNVPSDESIDDALDVEPQFTATTTSSQGRPEVTTPTTEVPQPPPTTQPPDDPTPADDVSTDPKIDIDLNLTANVELFGVNLVNLTGASEPAGEADGD